MAKNCGKCGKQVYPMDELKCLDKVWHKACFKCQVCSMLLSMKNYKGFEKMPYCSSHYPEIKHTQVAETPESKRIAENTKLQSQVKYHEDFEKAKGAKISVADDPETVRVRKNMQTISQAAYHGELEKKIQMEDTRPGEFELDSTPAAYQAPPPANRRQPGNISEYDPMRRESTGGGGVGVSPFTSRTQATVVFNSTQGGQAPPPAAFVASQPAAPVPSAAPSRQPAIATAAQPAAQPARAPVPVQQPPKDKFAGKGRVCEAVYDYDAGDEDEVGFREFDLIIDCDPVDDGWMIGTVEQNGRRGMLPANYVKKVNWN